MKKSIAESGSIERTIGQRFPTFVIRTPISSQTLRRERGQRAVGCIDRIHPGCKKGECDGDGDGGGASLLRVETMARDRGFRRSTDRGGPGGQRLRRDMAERMPGETGTRFSVWVDHLVLSGVGGLEARLGELGFERQPIRYAVNAPVFAHPGGIFPRLAIMAASPGGNGAGGTAPPARIPPSARSRSRSTRSRRSPGPTTWAWISRVTRWGPTGSAAYPGADDDGRRRAQGLPGLRTLPRRDGPRRPDEAARGPRRPGRAGPLARPSTPVRGRCPGVRRHRGDSGAGHRAGRIDRPGVSPGLRGRA